VQRSDTELEGFFDLSPDLLAVIRLDGGFVRVNAAFERTLGYPAAELLARSALDIVHPDDLPTARAALAQLADGRDVADLEVRVVCADGSVRWVEWSARTVPGRRVVHAVGQDTTDRRRAEAELQTLADEQAALRRVATLVARGAPPADMFAAVIGEVVRLLGADSGTLGRYEDDDTLTTMGFWSRSATAEVPVRHVIAPGTLARLVRDSSGPARVAAYAGVSGTLGEAARDLGWRSSVGVPVLVGGRVWGLIALASMSDVALPPETEGRLAAFAELLANAIGNAQSREDLTRLAEEQAALRRVATLVAEDVRADELFAAVVGEAGKLLRADLAGLIRYVSEDTVTPVATWAAEGEHPEVHGEWPLEGDRLATAILRTRRAAREEDWPTAGGPIAAFVRDEMRVRSSAGTPVIVGREVWGALFVHAQRRHGPLAQDTESRLMDFAELVGTAISNAAARGELSRLAEEQAALRHVATMVARESSPAEVLGTVAQEVAQVLGTEGVGMLRFEPDGAATLVAQSETPWDPVPLGTRFPLDGENLVTTIFRRREPARLDDWSDATGSAAAMAHTLGIRSSVATPIVVEGRLWGTLIAVSQQAEPLPADTEARIGEFTELVATAISHAEARADLAASRARIVVAADEERRQVVRDLHDGAQQRLVHTVVSLKLAQRALQQGEEATELVSDALDQAEQANVELRELAHGIMPSVLTRGGLRAGVEALASRMPLPVQIAVDVDRLPPAVEATAYFVVSEALTNVVKHARARRAEVAATAQEGELRIRVRDDGVGGARRDGSGLVGLGDRLAALDGRLSVESPAGGGTLVAADLPLRA
jgi:PAS domain S-box-containing protein